MTDPGSWREGTLEEIRRVVDSLRSVSVSLDLDETLRAILDGAKSLIPFDAAGIYVIEPDSRKLVGWNERGYQSPSGPSDSLLKAERILEKVLQSGSSLTKDVSAEPAYIEKRHSTQSEMAVGIIGSRGRVIGALNIESDRRQAYEPGTLALLSVFASGIAGAIERALLHSEILSTRRLENELVVARRVMRDLLPRELPELEGIEMAAALRPWLGVSGDFYDFIPIDHERWGIVIADVVGKGMPAALLVSALRASLHSLARNELAVRSVIQKANRFFCESSDASRFATLFYGEFDVPSRRLIYINAGHVPPVLIRKGGVTDRLHTGGLPMGVFADSRYLEGFAELGSGDLICLYTDGITEAFDAEENEYGEERLIELLCQERQASAQAICDAATRDVERFASGRQQDDRTLAILKVPSGARR